MKKKYVKYAFSSNGVLQWQLWLEGLTPVQRAQEAASVMQGLRTYLPNRYELSASQVAQLDAMDGALLHLWATQIAYAIQQGIPIALDKPEKRGDAGLRNTKFIVAASRTASNQLMPDAPAEREDGEYLCFTVVY